MALPLREEYCNVAHLLGTATNQFPEPAAQLVRTERRPPRHRLPRALHALARRLVVRAREHARRAARTGRLGRGVSNRCARPRARTLPAARADRVADAGRRDRARCPSVRRAVRASSRTRRRRTDGRRRRADPRRRLGGPRWARAARLGTLEEPASLVEVVAHRTMRPTTRRAMLKRVVRDGDRWLLASDNPAADDSRVRTRRRSRSSSRWCARTMSSPRSTRKPQPRNRRLSATPSPHRARPRARLLSHPLIGDVKRCCRDRRVPGYAAPT